MLMELVEESARLQSDLEESRRRIADLARLADEDLLSGAAQEQPADARDERGSHNPEQDPQDIVSLHGLDADDMSPQVGAATC